MVYHRYVDWFEDARPLSVGGYSDSSSSLVLIASKDAKSSLHHVVNGNITLENYQDINPPKHQLDWMVMLREGLVLLDKHAAADARVLALWFTNPFPALMDAPSPRGVLAYYDAGRTFGMETFADPVEVFADTHVAMFPKHLSPGRKYMQAAAEAWLNEHWERVDTPLWTLYLRPSPPPSTDALVD